ncbi:MAG: hypothetical protein ACLQGV_01380 [Bryobacteraceae bacterium]
MEGTEVDYSSGSQRSAPSRWGSSDQSSPGLRDGEAFSVRLKSPVKAVGVRIVGKPGGMFSTCAELAGSER